MENVHYRCTVAHSLYPKLSLSLFPPPPKCLLSPKNTVPQTLVPNLFFSFFFNFVLVRVCFACRKQQRKQTRCVLIVPFHCCQTVALQCSAIPAVLHVDVHTRLVQHPFQVSTAPLARRLDNTAGGGTSSQALAEWQTSPPVSEPCLFPRLLPFTHR